MPRRASDVRSILFDLLDAGAYLLDCAWSVLKPAAAQPPHAVAVYFHAVLDESGDRLVDPQEGMTSGFLRNFIRAMKSAGYTFVAPDSVLDAGRPGGNLAILTSDDGYGSIEKLLPVLRTEAAPLAVFLITGYSARGTISWWDQVYIAGIATSEARSRLKHRVASRGERDAALRELGVDPDAVWFSESHRLLTASDVGRLAPDPHLSFGNHTANHLSLPLLEESGLRDEVERAGRDIEAWTGGSVRSFAFPYGDLSERALDIVRDCGYRTIFTTEPGAFTLPATGGADGAHVIPRYRLRADRSAAWQARIMAKGITAGPRLQAKLVRWVRGGSA